MPASVTMGGGMSNLNATYYGKRSAASRTMGSKCKSRKIVRTVGKELKDNPPRILAKIRRKKGVKQASRQRVAILLSKSRARGAKV